MQLIPIFPIHSASYLTQSIIKLLLYERFIYLDKSARWSNESDLQRQVGASSPYKGVRRLDEQVGIIKLISWVIDVSFVYANGESVWGWSAI